MTYPLFASLGERMRRSDIDFRLLFPLMLSAAAVQAVVAIARVTTSYRVVELGLPVVWLGILSTAYAILPAFIALWLGRFIDRGHDALATWIGSVFLVVGSAGLLMSQDSLGWLLAGTAVLGIGNLFTVVSQQMLCVRCSGLRSRESVFGNYMVACAVGQGLGPLIVGWAGGDTTLPPTQMLFAIGLATSVIGLLCALPIRPSRETRGDDAGKAIMSVGQLLRIPGLWAVMLSSIISVTAADLIVIYLPLMGAERNIDVNVVGGLLTVRAVASLAARLIYARLITGFGRIPLMVASLVSGGVAFACVAIPMPILPLYVATAATGFALGIANTITVTSTVAMTAAGTRATANSLRVTGNRIAQVALPFGASLVATVAGAASIFVILAASLAASGAAVFWSRHAATKNQPLK
jgi:predicted MFS family arabinose efflux permease